MNDSALVHGGGELTDDVLTLLLYEHRVRRRPAFERLWQYYRNELDFVEGEEHRLYRAAQEQGLPTRLTRAAGQVVRSIDPGNGHREIVIENDIAWRIHTLVDFMFGKPVSIQSLADDPQLASLIEQVLKTTFEVNGGVCFFQDMALLGSVYGYVDLLLRVDQLPAVGVAGAVRDDGDADRAPSNPSDSRRALRTAGELIIETVEAPRAIPVLSPTDYRQLEAYCQHYTQQRLEVDRESLMARLRIGRHETGRLASTEVTEVWSTDRLRVYHDQRLVSERGNPIGRLPVVHIQNLAQPFYYEGLSEVEPLIPLQDELNTRLSDRANRVTFQSFKMYLGKGIENFLERPVGPGQMWTTDNPDASIESFGGDGPNPSEDAHIDEIRQAMDKTSAVTPLAAGLLRNKVGNLTSENALRIVMMGLLARTEKKRVTYGQGIERLCELILHTLDGMGVLRTRPEDRAVRLHWPTPLPENQTQRLKDAELKLRIGVSRRQVLAELGYQPNEAVEEQPSDKGASDE